MNRQDVQVYAKLLTSFQLSSLHLHGISEKVGAVHTASTQLLPKLYLSKLDLLEDLVKLLNVQLRILDVPK